MQGCGVKIWQDPTGAYRAAEGKFFADDYVGPVMACNEDAAREMAVEADVAAATARRLQVGQEAVYYRALEHSRM